MFDLGILYVVGVLGYVMRCADIPVAPAIIGLILGPLAEQQFRRALAISQGDLTVFFTRPISATILAIAAAALLVPVATAYWQRRRSNQSGGARLARLNT